MQKKKKVRTFILLNNCTNTGRRVMMRIWTIYSHFTNWVLTHVLSVSCMMVTVTSDRCSILKCFYFTELSLRACTV